MRLLSSCSFSLYHAVCESVVLRKCFVSVGKMMALLKAQGDWLGEVWMLSQILLDDGILVVMLSLGWRSTSFPVIKPRSCVGPQCLDSHL